MTPACCSCRERAAAVRSGPGARARLPSDCSKRMRPVKETLTPKVIREPCAEFGASVQRIGWVANYSVREAASRALRCKLLDSQQLRVGGAARSRCGIHGGQLVARDLVGALLRRSRAVGIAARHPLDSDGIAFDRVRAESRDHSLHDSAVFGIRSF